MVKVLRITDWEYSATDGKFSASTPPRHRKSGKEYCKMQSFRHDMTVEHMNSISGYLDCLYKTFVKPVKNSSMDRWRYPEVSSLAVELWTVDRSWVGSHQLVGFLWPSGWSHTHMFMLCAEIIGLSVLK